MVKQKHLILPDFERLCRLCLTCDSCFLDIVVVVVVATVARFLLAVTICVGFSIDFVAHLAVAYNESEDTEEGRYVKSVLLVLYS